MLSDKPFEESTALIINSVFRVSRNRKHLGFVLILIGISILMGSLTPFVIIPFFGLFIDVVFIKGEQKMLEETFGERWLDYKQKVRRWI